MVNPNGESAAGANFQADDEPRRDAGLIARLLTADPMERTY